MQNLGRAGRCGEFFDIRMDIGEMVRLYCLSATSEDGDYGAVSYPSRGTVRLHEEITRIFPQLADEALELMCLRAPDQDTVVRELSRIWSQLLPGGPGST